MSQVFKSPAAYVQGRGVADEIGTHAASLGEHALLLADEIVLGLVEDRVLASLEDAGMDASSVDSGCCKSVPHRPHDSVRSEW